MRARAWAAVALLVTCTGCAGSSDPSTEGPGAEPGGPVAYYLRDPDGTVTISDSQIRAELTVVDGCLLGTTDGGTVFVPAFPEGVTFDDGVGVTSEGVVLPLGEPVELGGGDPSVRRDSAGIHYVPDECQGRNVVRVHP